VVVEVVYRQDDTKAAMHLAGQRMTMLAVLLYASISKL